LAEFGEGEIPIGDNINNKVGVEGLAPLSGDLESPANGIGVY